MSRQDYCRVRKILSTEEISQNVYLTKQNKNCNHYLKIGIIEDVCNSHLTLSSTMNLAHPTLGKNWRRPLPQTPHPRRRGGVRTAFSYRFLVVTSRVKITSPPLKCVVLEYLVKRFQYGSISTTQTYSAITLWMQESAHWRILFVLYSNTAYLAQVWL